MTAARPSKPLFPGPRNTRRTLSRVAAALVSIGVFISPAEAVPPIVPAGDTQRIAENVYVIPDHGVPLVPNIGIVTGTESVLVVDTGMGPANAETVLEEVKKLSDLPIRYLVSTHFHPEHNFGAQSFPDDTILIYSIAQQRDLQRKGGRYRQWFVEMFGEDVRELLEPVRLVPADVTFERRAAFDLGGLPVELHHFGKPAHTGGDTIVFLPEQGIAFVGGLVPSGSFPIIPDEDSSVEGWIATLDRLRELGAETIVPGHGPVGRATLLIETVRGYLVSIESRATDLFMREVPLESARNLLFDEFADKHPEWSEPHWIRNAVERVYAERSRAE